MKYKRIVMIGIDLLLAIIGDKAGLMVYYFTTIISECPAKAVGILCPACGGTRLSFYLLSGNFSAAFFVNPFLFITAIYAMILFFLWNLSWIFNLRFAQRALRLLLDYRIFIGWGIGMLIFFLIRNLI